jgi:hypothetical protein
MWMSVSCPILIRLSRSINGFAAVEAGCLASSVIIGARLPADRDVAARDKKHAFWNSHTDLGKLDSMMKATCIKNTIKHKIVVFLKWQLTDELEVLPNFRNLFFTTCDPN